MGARAIEWSRGVIRVAESKSKAGRRILPEVPAVCQALKGCQEAQEQPTEGWVFPAGFHSGHLEEGTDKKYHDKALKALTKAHQEKPEENPEVRPFEPYWLRHTALTWFDNVGGDAYDLARIAGHSNIKITQQHVHSDSNAIEATIQKLAAGKKWLQTLVTAQNRLFLRIARNLRKPSENNHVSWWTWRGSNRVPLLRIRNLLISQSGRNAKNGQNASLRYTAGTRQNSADTSMLENS